MDRHAGVTGDNPYVGPRPFKQGQKIYGRDRAIRDLVNLLLAERVVLMYSPSGAGKTSLIQAGLIPEVERMGFVVSPRLRVNREPPPGPAPDGFNRYVHSIRSGLVTSSVDDPPDDVRELLIFDQFEEVLTIDPSDVRGRREFFEEVGRLLDHPNRRALFAIREEFLAALDPYRRHLLNSLDVRYRLDLLDARQAQDAIVKPAADQEVTFEPDAATLLANQLRTVNVLRPDGTVDSRIGPHVEPVQLQIVCERLWEVPRADPAAITVDDVHAVTASAASFVDESLGMYYAEKVAVVAGARSIPERELRHWISTHLISEQGIRLPLLDEGGEIEGMSSKVVNELVEARLIRREDATGRPFVELSHDRLVHPIVTDNKSWADANLEPWQRAAMAWDRQGLDSLLLKERDLRPAQRSATDTLTPYEEEFRLRSIKADRDARALRIARRIGVVVGVAAVVLGIVALVAWRRAAAEADRATSRQLAALAADPATPN
ncbi:MAG: ATP-binding protein, partial [Ilumatobacter sp.]|nr:ATP-binding protein [Ilumatobacter sp.]